MERLVEISESIQRGDAPGVKSLTEKAVNEDVPVELILNQGLVAGMNAIGEKFKNLEIFIPEVLVAAKAMKSGMAVVRPLLKRAGVKPKGKIVMGTVKGDLHDIGKNIVCMMLEGAGYEVVDLGTDVDKDVFLKTARREGAQVVGMSAMLTTTMVHMKEVVDEFARANLRDSVRLIVGGAPISPAYCKGIGADGYAADAATAVDLVNSLVQK